MYIFHLLSRRIIYLICLTSVCFSDCWTVKIVNLTDKKITVDIHSSQLYPGWNSQCKYWSALKSWTGCPTKNECGFLGKQIDPHATQDFNYKEVNPICIAPCTKSVKVTSPVELSVQNSLTSCSNVIVTISQDKSNKWKIEYHDWTNDILKMLEERTRMPLAVREMFDQFAESPIQSISVFRQPIATGINELMKIIAKNELKRLNYDELFHTGFIIKCQDKLIRLERNHTISSILYIKPGNKEKFEQKEVVLPNKVIHYNEFIINAMENDLNFWKYDPVTNNCQLFVLQALEKNNIKIPEDLRTFIYQDAGKILANNPILEKIGRGATSLVNRIDNIVEQIKIKLVPQPIPTK